MRAYFVTSVMFIRKNIKKKKPSDNKVNYIQFLIIKLQ
jgi:hypothetical protein